jgi:hypothetical protein
MAQTPQHRSSKRRAPQGELRNLTSAAREKLHAWFREQNGTIPYREIIKRLRDEFDIKAGLSTLSDYYNEKAKEIERGRDGGAASASTATTIVIRIEVPAGCAVAVSTEERA